MQFVGSHVPASSQTDTRHRQIRNRNPGWHRTPRTRVGAQTDDERHRREDSGFDHRDVAEAVRRVMAARWMPLNASSVDKMMRDIVKPADGSTKESTGRNLWL